jgi:hypothetical protein
VGQRESHDRVAGLQQRVVDGGVGLGAGVRLDVRVLGAEQRLGAVDRQLLDDVDPLAAAVVARSRIALGVLVGEHAALAFEHGARNEVLRGDQLQRVLLALQLERERLRDLRIDVGQRTVEVVGRKLVAHHHEPTSARSTAEAATAPARTIRQRPVASSSPRSTTVEGVPGSWPRRARDRRPRGSPPAPRPACAPRRHRRGSRWSAAAGRPASSPTSITRTPSSPLTTGQREAAGRVRQEQRQRPRQQRATAARVRPPSSAARRAPPAARRRPPPRASGRPALELEQPLAAARSGRRSRGRRRCRRRSARRRRRRSRRRATGGPLIGSP